MEDFDVGLRLLEVRKNASLSQRALAERAGVPHGQISLIETNSNSPSVASLRKVLQGVPMSLGEFFESEIPDTNQVFYRQEELTDLTSHLGDADESGKPAIEMRQVGDARKHNLQVLHERYSPGSDTGDTYLEHRAQEGGVVVSGEIEITVGSQKKILKAGDAYLFDSRTPHRFRNITKKDAVVISACTPPYL